MEFSDEEKLQLEMLKEFVKNLSEGKKCEKIKGNFSGETKNTVEIINRSTENIFGLHDEVLAISKAGYEGKLDVRGDSSRYPGYFGNIIGEINNTLDNMIGPMIMAAEYIERISRGDLPDIITDEYKGDFNEVKNNLNLCIGSISLLVDEIKTMSSAVYRGDLEHKIEVSKFEGDYATLASDFNDCIGEAERIINVAGSFIEDVANGRELTKITKETSGYYLILRDNINCCIDVLYGILGDIGNLTEAAVGGQLDVRADASVYAGAWANVVGGINNVLDAMIAPMILAAEYIERISRGDIPEKITDHYRGDFNEIKDNLNLCIDGLGGLVEADKILQNLKVNDFTEKTRGQYEGIFQEVCDALNQLVDHNLYTQETISMIADGNLERLPEYQAIGRRCGNDNLMPAYISMMGNIQSLVNDSNYLTEAAVRGELDVRADSSRLKGDYKKIIEGVNDTLDTVVGPINEAMKVSDELAKGNFTVRFDEKLDVAGDFVKFKDALNNIGMSVSGAVKSANEITLQVASNSNEVSKGSDEVAKAAEGVAASSQKSAELTKGLLIKIEGIHNEINNLSASNEEIASTSQEVLSAAKDVVAIGKDAQVLGNDTNKKMGNVENIAKESVDEINNLTNQIKQVSDVVKIINDITSQINLLALNAAIEAARAGEHGRGFAVVAGEVKNLAAEARAATESIEKVVLSIQDDSQTTAAAINAANKEIIEGVESVNKTLEALNTIISTASQVTYDIGEITDAIENQTKISINVVGASEEGNKMAKDVLFEAEELAALAEEASASIEEIGSAINEVSSLSKMLKGEMEKFRV